MFENVVVGVTDPNEATRAVRRATEVARASGGTLHIVTASEVPTSATKGSAESGLGGGCGAQDGVAADGLLGHLCDMAAAAQVPVSTHSVSAEPADAIARVALQNDADLIVVGTRTRGSGRQLSAVPKALLDKAPCAVLVV